MRYRNEIAKPVCLDVKCFEKKNRAAQAAINKENRQKEKEFTTLKEEAIEFRGDDMGKREWVYIVARVLYEPLYSSEWSREKIKKAFYQKHGWPEPKQEWNTVAMQKEKEQLIQRLEDLTIEQLQQDLLWLVVKPAAEDEFFTKWWLEGLPKSEPAGELTGGEYVDETLHPNVGWILQNSCGDINYKTNIPNLTDEELLYCIKKETRTSGLRQLEAEARRRGLDLKAAG